MWEAGRPDPADPWGPCRDVCPPPYARRVTSGRLPAVRAVRSLALTATAVGAGLVAHWHAGGPTPHPVALLVLLALLTLPVARLSVREVSPVVATVVLGAGQLAVHLLGMAGVGGASTVAGPGHVHSVVLDGTPSSGSAPGMLGAHLVVTLVLAAAWSRGERILFAVASRLRPPAVPRWSVPAVVAVTVPAQAAAGTTGPWRATGRAPPLPER